MLHRNGCRRGFRHNWKLNDEPGADGMIFLYANGAMMIFDDAADDGQAEPGAALLGGEIRQEEFFFELAGDAVSGVGHGDLDRVAGGNQCGRNLNLADEGILRGLGCVVDQVGYRTA